MALRHPQGSNNPLKLWQWLAQYERKTGGEVLAIAHNGNLSNGMMFPLDVQSDGKPLDAHYVRERDKWEPLYEATQIKGNGESSGRLKPVGGSSMKARLAVVRMRMVRPP